MGFSIAPSHDVDVFYPAGRWRKIKKLVSERKFRSIPATLGNPVNPFQTIERIREIERQYDAESTFFFLTKDSDYNFDDTEVARTISDLEAEGVEVGLHGSIESHNTLSALIEEKQSLEAVTENDVVGIRQHYHKLDKMPTKTFELQRIAGFEYDSTFVPQAFGNSREYEPFQAVTGLTEIPVSFADRDYQDVIRVTDFETAWDRVENVLDIYRKHEGVCCVSWHPHVYYDEDNIGHRLFYPDFEGFTELYDRILEYGYEHGAELTSLAEIAERTEAGPARW